MQPYRAFPKIRNCHLKSIRDYGPCCRDFFLHANIRHAKKGGCGLFLAPLIVTNEFIGLFSKPFALMVRLFANMLAGHMIIFVLLYLSIMFQSLIVGVVTVPVAVAVCMLEVLIAFIQAYIFTFLSAIFIGMAASEH